VAGNGTSGFSGDGGAATSAQFALPFSVALDSAGNLYIADQANSRIRKMTAAGTVSTVAGNGTIGYLGDGAAATSAELDDPEGVASDGAGNLFIADTLNGVIRKVTTSGTITTVAGSNIDPGYGGDGAPAINAQISYSSAVVVDSAGNYYFTDIGNQRIRRVAASNGFITTVAGNGASGFGGDGGVATLAAIKNPDGLALDAAGNLYIADTANHRIRKVTPSGIITTIAGSGTSPGFAGDNGPATSALLNNPKGVAVDASGNVFIADTFNQRIRVVSTAGIITTIAGNGFSGYLGDGGPAITAQLQFPSGVAVGPNGVIYVADGQNNVIRLLTPPAVSTVPAISAGGVVSAAAFGGFTSVAPGSWIEIYGTNLAVDSRPWGTSDFNGPNAPKSLDGTKVTIGGQSAFVSFISAGQVNVQAPSTTPTGSQQVILTTPNGTSAPYQITVNARQPGLLAPASFNVGGTQYAAGLFADGTTYVAPPGAIPGVVSRQAQPGETITIYGVGFGPVIPNIPAGQIVLQNNATAASMQVSFGQTAASLAYAGLAPGLVGVYQFNVVVPSVPDNDSLPLTFTLGGVAGTQTLYTAVKN
jgi:uncharacterized protein (TIGR03437 family)